MTMAETRSFRFERLHHVQLAIPVDGEDVCRAFWGKGLGMLELEKPPKLARGTGCWFRGDGLEIHLKVSSDFVPSPEGHPAILVRNLPALARRLRELGKEPEWDDRFEGFIRFYVHDPFGNRLEFLQAIIA